MKKLIAMVALVLVVAVVAGMFFTSEDGKKVLNAFNGGRVENGIGEESVNKKPAPTATPVPNKPDQNEDENPQEEQAAILEYVDQETGKMYYQVVGCSTVEFIEFLRVNVTAVEAVDAIECVYLGASMVASHDDSRIVMVNGKPFTAYELFELSDQSSKEHMVFELDRQASKLFACEAGEKFVLSDKTDKTFQGYSDAKAYVTWICERHDAVRSVNLLFEGYPLADGYRGTFKIEKGFDPRTLQAVVLVETEENRYDWMLCYCGCSQASEQSGKPAVKPTEKPTTEPTVKPTAKPTAEPTVKPTAKPTEKPTTEPTVKPTAKPTEKPTTEPTVKPTAKPTEKPTAEPTAKPTVKPTPENNSEPEADPTRKPTVKPTPENNSEPEADPTRKPTATPAATKAPVVNPDPTRKPVTQEPEIDEGYGEVSGDFDPFN